MSRRIFIDIDPHHLTVLVTTGTGDILDQLEVEDDVETYEHQVVAIVRDTIRAVTG